MSKTLEGIKEEGFDYHGIIFFGLMMTKKGVYLLEYNVRMGDPETQSVLYLMDSDLVDLIQSSVDEKLSENQVSWKKGVCINVVLASYGYPLKYNTGYEIEIDKDIKSKIFFAGAKKEDGVLKTSGGRVLSVIGMGKDASEAREHAYSNLKCVTFDGAYCRKDIGTFK